MAMTLDGSGDILKPATDRGDWYVGFTKPRQEGRAAENLRRQGFNCYVPLIEVQRRVSREIIWRQEALFPRYIFLRPESISIPLERIRFTYGMNGLIRFGGVPATVSNSIVEQLVELSASRRKGIFSQGEFVRFIEGPLMGLNGVFEGSEGEERAIVLLEFLQREQRVTVPARFLKSVH